MENPLPFFFENLFDIYSTRMKERGFLRWKSYLTLETKVDMASRNNKMRILYIYIESNDALSDIQKYWRPCVQIYAYGLPLSCSIPVFSGACLQGLSQTYIKDFWAPNHFGNLFLGNLRREGNTYTTLCVFRISFINRCARKLGAI